MLLVASCRQQMKHYDVFGWIAVIVSLDIFLPTGMRKV
jgi:hypothetical protein